MAGQMLGFTGLSRTGRHDAAYARSIFATKRETVKPPVVGGASLEGPAADATFAAETVFLSLLIPPPHEAVQ